MINHRIKLLITLVLFMVAATAVWTSSQADARALKKGATSNLSVTRPDVTPTSGDPDVGQGATPPPAPALKHLNQQVGEGKVKSSPLNEWVHWAGRIWATLYLRVFG